jgi:DNA-binding PadR family transcriptional regulator
VVNGRERSLLLELAILGLLKEQEMHGYELKKRLTDVLGFGRGVSFGSLYPALSRLEAAGSVKAVEAASGAGRPIPLTGSLGGELAAFRARASAVRGRRGKKVYGITAEGQRRFDELLASEDRPSEDDRLFSLRLAFARYLPAEVRLGLLERRRTLLVERLSGLGQRLRASRGRIDAYARSLMEHDRESTARDISWLERLIAEERGDNTPPAPAAPTDTTPAADQNQQSASPRPSESGAINPDASPGAITPDSSPTEVPPS